MSKQTAVEWLQNQYDINPESFLTDEDFQQALALEREQIEEAYNQGVFDFNNENYAEFMDASDYYTQTYQP